MSAADILVLVGKVNLAAAVAILVVLGLRPLVRKYAGARLTYALWLLPLVAMAASLAPARRVVVQVAAAVPSHLPALSPAMIPDTWGEAFAGPAHAMFDPAPFVLALWIGGAVAAVLAMARLQHRFTRDVAKGDVGPAVVGVIAPRIVTPDDFTERFDAEQQMLVLAHEQTHLRRQDTRLNGLATALQCLFWFNPLIHLAIRPMRIDQELACDEAVVDRYPDARFAYAQALVKTQLANRPLPLGCYWPSGTRHPLLERIAMIKTANFNARRRLAGGCAVAALCAASAFAAWAATPATTLYQPIGSVEPASPIVRLAQASSAQTPATTAARPAKAAAPKASATPSPSDAEAPPAPPAQVCVSNSCSTQTTTAGTTTAVVGGITRVTHVGSAPLPASQPFAKYWDADAPVNPTGRVTSVNMTYGMAGEIIVTGDDGKTYRVMGGDPANLTPDQLATLNALPGQTVNVRGYAAFDTTCEGGCLVNGRDVTFPNGTNVGARPAPPSPSN